MNKRYEAVIIFDSGLSDTDVEAQIERVDAIVKSHNGTIDKKDIWGRRSLAYKIGKKDHGIYVVLVFSGDNSLVADLRRQLRINEAAMRFLIVDKDQYAPDFSRQNHGDTSPTFRDGGAFRDGGGFREGGFRDGGFREGGYRDDRGPADDMNSDDISA